jgi:hypothetical protein
MQGHVQKVGGQAAEQNIWAGESLDGGQQVGNSRFTTFTGADSHHSFFATLVNVCPFVVLAVGTVPRKVCTAGGLGEDRVGGKEILEICFKTR